MTKNKSSCFLNVFFNLRPICSQKRMESTHQQKTAGIYKWCPTGAFFQLVAPNENHHSSVAFFVRRTTYRSRLVRSVPIKIALVSKHYRFLSTSGQNANRSFQHASMTPAERSLLQENPPRQWRRHYHGPLIASFG